MPLTVDTRGSLVLRVSDRSRFISAHSGGVQHSPMNDAQLLRDVPTHASCQLRKRVTPWEHSQVSIRTCSSRVEGLSQIRASTRSFVSLSHCMRRNAVDLNHNRNNVDVDINRTMPWIFTYPWFGADGEWHCNFDVIGTGF